ncbi:methylmalonyl-CoA decarboxylase [Azoarcus sp. KH32C]|uniref:methylmalonyl-CoA decarboxylase n=1 Tax=Azoarcus sp. KH32C TaxID=748247 RepID=UPI0002386746|nr:methylmalonyl-CoA decarboxylase [Azoarcus sp. KH32C]BAL24759.1 enoyl-CoA hydratase/isomerase [Azoarcus sp. KH32C]
MPLVICSIDHKVATLTLDHSAKRNCLSETLVDELLAGLDACREAQIRCVVLRAQPGTAVWSAGHDVSELPEGGRDPLGWKDPLRKLVREIEAFPAPVIAMIEGSVWGGACETVFACDLIVATPESTFAATPARHGVPYNVSGLLTFFNAAHARIANEMLFTAQPIPAMRLERMGIINHVVAADDLEEIHLCHRADDRQERAALDLGDERAATHPRRRTFDVAARLRAHPGAAPRRLRQPRLRGGDPGVQGKAQTGIHRGVRITGGACTRYRLGLTRAVVS